MTAAHHPQVSQTIAELTRAFADTPWIVQPMQDGVLVGLDLANARWWELLGQAGLKETFTYTVRFDPASGTCSITDTCYNLEWRAGVDGRPQPYLTAAAQATQGRVWKFEKTHIATPLQGTVVDIDFSTGPSRAKLRKVLKENGWKEKVGGQQMLGAIIACIGGAVALGVVLLVLLL